MASKITQDELAARQEQRAQQAPTTDVNASAGTGNVAAGTELQTSQPAANPYTGIKGLSDTTAQGVAQYSGPYQAGSSVQSAQDYLNNVIAGKPGNYSSTYQGQLEKLYDQVMNRPQFQYDLNGDMLYKQYADQYQQAGKRAMQDTMGNAASLTGGYGSSYASTAGNQAYQGYLNQLNNMVPELYDRAYNRYQQEGNALTDQFGMAAQMENQDYGRYRDQMSDWNQQYQMANQEYWNQYNADYNQFADQRNFYQNLASQENANYQAERQYAYQYAMALLNEGLLPDTAWLELAGISEDDALEIFKDNGGHVSSGHSSSSKKKSTGSGTQAATGTSGTSMLNKIITGAGNLATTINKIGTTLKDYSNTSSLYKK